MIQENGLTPKSAILTKLASQKPFMPPHIALAYDHHLQPFIQDLTALFSS